MRKWEFQFFFFYDEASDFNMWEIYRKELEVDGRTFNLLVQDTGEYNERHSKKKNFNLFFLTIHHKFNSGGQDEFYSERVKCYNSVQLS